jgi:hypothetical protein
MVSLAKESVRPQMKTHCNTHVMKQELLTFTQGVAMLKDEPTSHFDEKLNY